MIEKSRGNRPLRVGVDARPLATPFTGIGRYTYNVLKRLVEAGHDWYLYSSIPIENETLRKSNTVWRQGNHLPASLGSVLEAQWRYPKWARQDQIDIFWSPRHHLPLLLDKNIKAAVTAHDVVWRRYPESMPLGARLLEKLLMPPSLTRADRIFCVSEFTRGELLHFWPQISVKTQVTYNGPGLMVEEGLLTAAPWPKPYILSVGTPEPRKNLERLIGAFAKLVAGSGIAEDLIIIGGNGWGGVDLKKRVGAEGLSGRVHLLGQVDDAALARYYQHARCLVMVSLYEGFGLPVVEAMQFGVPGVVASGGALEEVGGNACVLCDPLDEESIAVALSKLLDDTDLYTALSQAGKECAASFDWEESAESTVRALEELVY